MRVWRLPPFPPLNSQTNFPTLPKPLTSMLHCQVTEYLERLSDVRGLSKMALRRVEHLYYKNDMVYGAMRKLVQQQQAATAQQTTQTAQEGSDEAVEAEDLDEEQTEAKQVTSPTPCIGLAQPDGLGKGLVCGKRSLGGCAKGGLEAP